MIFGDIWEDRVFLNGLVKFREIRNSRNVSEIIIIRLSLTMDIMDKNWWKSMKTDQNRWKSILTTLSIFDFQRFPISIDFIDYRILSIGHAGKIIYWILPTNSLLHKMKKVASPSCPFCPSECQTLWHLLLLFGIESRSGTQSVVIRNCYCQN